MALLITCPNCGSRAYTEFWFGGEVPADVPEQEGAAGLAADFGRVWYRRNVAGVQTERWFHFAGCRRWLTLRRDTRSNAVVHAGD